MDFKVLDDLSVFEILEFVVKKNHDRGYLWTRSKNKSKLFLNYIDTDLLEHFVVLFVLQKMLILYLNAKTKRKIKIWKKN